MTTTSVSPLSPSSKADLVSSPLRLLTRRFFSHGDVLRSPAALRTQASLYPLFHSALKNLDSAFPHGFLQQVNSVPSVEPFRGSFPPHMGRFVPLVCAYASGFSAFMHHPTRCSSTLNPFLCTFMHLSAFVKKGVFPSPLFM